MAGWRYCTIVLSERDEVVFGWLTSLRLISLNSRADSKYFQRLLISLAGTESKVMMIKRLEKT